MNAKKRDQQTHAVRRAYERYGLRLTQNDLAQMVQTIQAGDAAHVLSQSLRVSLFDVAVQGQLVRVVYDRQRKSIASVLAPDMDGFQ